MLDSLRGCCARGVRGRPGRGPGVDASSPHLGFPGMTWGGFCSTPAAMTRPCTDCAACWQYDRMTQGPLGTLESYSSPKMSLRKQSPFWRRRFLFLTGAQALLGYWSGRMLTPGDARLRSDCLAN